MDSEMDKLVCAEALCSLLGDVTSLLHRASDDIRLVREHKEQEQAPVVLPISA